MFDKLIKSLNSPRNHRYYDLMRGRNIKVRHDMGLLELQHPYIWNVPMKAYVLSFICNQLSFLKLSHTQRKVMIAVIGHTWGFGKASEFISRKQFIKGKCQKSTGTPLVGPANISPSSLAPAIKQLVRQGVMRKIVMAGPHGSMPLYSPNPWAGGSHLCKYESEERNWSWSSYKDDVRSIIDSLQGFNVYISGGYESMRYRLFGELANQLRHPELLPLFVEQHLDDLNNFMIEREEIDKATLEYIEQEKIDFHYDIDMVHEMWEDLPSKAEEKELAWLDSPTVNESIQNLCSLRATLDGPISDDITDQEATLLIKLLIMRWGETMLTLSVDAWKQFEMLATNYSTPYEWDYKKLYNKRSEHSWIGDCEDKYAQTASQKNK